MALHRQCLQNHCRSSKHRWQRSGHTSNLSFIFMVIYVLMMAESENPPFGSNILFAKVIKKKKGQQNGQSLTTQNTFLYSSLVIYFRKLFSTTFTSKCQLDSSGPNTSLFWRPWTCGLLYVLLLRSVSLMCFWFSGFNNVLGETWDELFVCVE